MPAATSGGREVSMTGRTPWWAMGLVTGAGLAYFLDPGGGRQRRSLLRGKARHSLKEASLGLQRSARDLSHRAGGVMAEARGAFQGHDATDDVLLGRVRAQLGRVCSHPHAIITRADGTMIIVEGDVLRREYQQLLSAIKSVRGVRQVIDRLRVHEDAEGASMLAGGVRRPGPRFELLQSSWSPAARLVVGTLGGAITVGRLRRGDPVGGILGALLTTRAFTNQPLSRLFGVGGRRPIEVQKTLHISAPIDRVFAFFRDLSEYPRFMSHVRTVRERDERRSHWVVDGPAGSSIEWDAEISREEPNRLIAWRSLPGATVGHSGVARFEPEGAGTRLTLRLSYSPPLGVIGHFVATMFGKDPKRALDDDLLRLKSLLEEGRATGRDEQVRIEDLSPGKNRPQA
jgi:uncharacterized membrane protein